MLIMLKKRKKIVRLKTSKIRYTSPIFSYKLVALYNLSNRYVLVSYKPHNVYFRFQTLFFQIT